MQFSINDLHGKKFLHHCSLINLFSPFFVGSILRHSEDAGLVVLQAMSSERFLTINQKGELTTTVSTCTTISGPNAQTLLSDEKQIHFSCFLGWEGKVRLKFVKHLDLIYNC